MILAIAKLICITIVGVYALNGMFKLAHKQLNQQEETLLLQDDDELSKQIKQLETQLESEKSC